ncbi:hypothetical protein RV10_GL001307 [Enterococcus pallens]|nr:hypothetical protein RV10_GL001307 [Enterococcus pallens]
MCEGGKYMKKAITSEQLVWIQQDFTSREALFSFMSQQLYEKGYVNEGYQEEIISREEKFPTGLVLENYNVGIPHCDSQYVKKDFIAIVILSNYIQMNQMDKPDNEIPVKYLFFLGLQDANNHLKILKKIMKVIKSEQLIHRAENSQSVKEISELLKIEIELEEKVYE